MSIGASLSLAQSDNYRSPSWKKPLYLDAEILREKDAHCCGLNGGPQKDMSTSKSLGRANMILFVNMILFGSL